MARRGRWGPHLELLVLSYRSKTGTYNLHYREPINIARTATSLASHSVFIVSFQNRNRQPTLQRPSKPRRSPKGATLVGLCLPGKAHFATLLTPLRARPSEILAYAEECQLVKPTDQGYVAVPDQGKYYRYHGRYGYSTDECQAWRKEIEALVQSGQSTRKLH
nr:reverse transcriptase domain-containing protein [Ipomoea batatas]